MYKIHPLPNKKKIALPEKFTFPFYYDPHPLAIEASEILQNYLKTTTDFDHNFGLDNNRKDIEIGKMFGVLVVKTKENTLGFLAAFSGKLANKNHWDYFVPPIFDMLKKDSYFHQKEEILNDLNNSINTLENQSYFIDLQNYLTKYQLDYQKKITDQKQKMKRQKSQRDMLRRKLKEKLSPEEFENENAILINESLAEKRTLRDLKEKQNLTLKKIENQLSEYKKKIEDLKCKRKRISNHLQTYLFQQYQFLNQDKKSKNLLAIFGKNPPAAAGECAAPKLLQYAFLHDLLPICMAEFWWGASPKSAVRKHAQYYPACTQKCQPILGHMLSATLVDDNPLLIDTNKDKEIEFLYEDDAIIVINKPENFLSVPGIQVKDSVQTRLQQQYPHISSPMIVHRLDMQTSGLMVIAKSKIAHEKLQKQFLKKKVKKRYVALLGGEVNKYSGEINLPLRVDLEDRPRQLVCYQYGKNAKTLYQVESISNGITRIFFYPITGRTHQLRVHAAHSLGLDSPILGDDLYGQKASRLFLHAECLEFFHPISNKKLTFIKDPNF
ncbi:RluA family pseudouridine synthase [Weeksella virosa]|uniref:Pseudouridine synthase n=1 Tax=Weeksella virosa (strain ATCC 43766 / DSM 16922 / JCM 21250 / CCUG 30538 / CDC 9751 / IAM 14551 / NBRC 16016 / NCTC 11634 / CL345/78) TaxID=865938 RepID=F0P1G7_WEEVC|nr:RluA family pseudouridine synthase [Weeksella virosa]ADX68681.1 pseudouridine synthase [Weeksella virosa DSM 16922]SUP55029.1 Ribosomal large subunit pseudouridine synthase A [Weeksella virosa]VEH63650.1 Ribosomal large subunit pseudouridine synthase A [Weeksella virosa]